MGQNQNRNFNFLHRCSFVSSELESRTDHFPTLFDHDHACGPSKNVELRQPFPLFDFYDC